MGADPVFILLTILAAVLIGYWMTHQARKKRRPPRTAGMPPTARQSQGEKNAMLTELNAELDRLGALLQPTKQTEPGPQMHVLKSLQLISGQLTQLHKRLQVLERKAAVDQLREKQYEKH